MIFIHASYSLVAIPILSQLIFEKLKSKFVKAQICLSSLRTILICKRNIWEVVFNITVI